MKRFLLITCVFLTYTFAYSQTTICDPNITSLCAAGPFPAATSGTAIAPAGTNFGCNPTVTNSAFFYFESGISGPLFIDIDPVDVNGNPLGNDLDFICWGPFSSTANMCNNLTALNEQDCSVAWSGVNEVCTIPMANAGSIYVILVENFSFFSSPNPCFINFTPSSPFSCCDFAGGNSSITPCINDPAFNLITELNGQADTNGFWINESGNSVDSIFTPSSDTAGTFRYIIPPTAACPGDTAEINITLLNGVNLSITSSSEICSDMPPLILTANIPGGTFSGNNVIDSIFTPDVSIIGSNTISYIYTAPNGCLDTTTQNIIVYDSPTVLAIDEIYNHPACFGDTNGNISITPSGGTPGYSYSWSNSQINSTITNLSTGSYTYIVTDTNTCTYSNTITLNDPINNLGTLTAYNSNCYGDNNGAISINIIGATTPPGTVSDPLDTLGYCLSAPNTTQFSTTLSSIIEAVTLNGDNFSINNNTAGIPDFYEDYTSTDYADITENQTYTIDVTLNGIAAPLVSNNNASGKVFIDFNIDGDFNDLGEEIGVIPYGINTSANLSFSVPITNVYGPTRMRIVSQKISDPNLIGPCDYADPSIPFSTPWFGATEDYSIVLSAPIVTSTYQWSNGETTDSISNLIPGKYIVTITPSNGCAVQDSAEILEPQQILFNATIVTDISCNNLSDGQISLIPDGGNGGPYIIDWDSANPLALGGGTYTITISDPSTITATNLIACENDTTITIIEPAYFSIDFTVSSNEICLDDTLKLNFDFNQGGVPEFMVNYTENGNLFSAGPFSAGQQQINITPNVGNNTYIITSITDSTGCTNQNTNNSEDIYVNPLPDINIAVAPNPICVGDNATLLFSVPNGTAPYVVDYFNDGVASTENVPSAGLSLLVNPTTTTVYGLSFVTDSKGCKSTLTDSAILVVNEVPQLNASYPIEFCAGEPIEIDLTFTVGSPPFNLGYTFNGTSTSTTINSLQSTLSFVSTSPTNISLDTITSFNCINAINETILITTNPLPIATISGDYQLCGNNEEAVITIVTTSGNPLYTIVYTDGTNINSITNATSNATINTKIQGVYSLISVTGTNGCESINMNGFATVIINPLPDVAISAYPTQTEITDPLIYFQDRGSNHILGEWDFGDGQTQASNFNTINHIYSDTGTYQVSLTTVSIDSCVSKAYQTIIISPTFTIYIPNAFTPNNDLDNDYFMPILEGVQEFEMSIYDRLGQRIFRTTDYSNEYCIKGCSSAWDGKVNNGSEYGTVGVYIYNLVITDINGKLRTFEGPVRLIR